MVKYSDDTEYEMIELASLFDLDNARIVQAQINSIDGANNCAAITFSSECAELSGLSVDAVKFFYHCENSTGTEEDLADGHKAFKANEYVYCLWCPASPSVDERFFIIGHVDIRGTKRCGVGDYLIIVMGWDTVFDPIEMDGIPSETYGGNIVTVFDANAGTTLDVESFANIDENSPAKPSSLPCSYDSAFTAWFEYNFSSAAPAHSCPLTISEYGPNVGDVTSYVDTRNDESCDREYTVVTTGGIALHHTFSKDGSNIVTEGGKSYYSTISSEMSLDYSYSSGISGWSFSDGITTGVFHATFSGAAISSASMSASGNGSQFSGSASITWGISCSSNFCDDNFIAAGNSGTITYGGDATIFRVPRFEQGLHGLAVGTSVAGAYGFYVLCNARDNFYCEDTWTPYAEYAMYSKTTETFCEIDAPYFCHLPNQWGYATIASPYYTLGLSYCFVSLFDEIDGDLGATIPGVVCLQARNAGLSRALESTFKELKMLIFDAAVDHESWALIDPRIFACYQKKVSTAP